MLGSPAVARAAVRHLVAADPALALVMERVGPCQLEPRPVRSPYESLGRAVVHQQLSGKAAAAILARVQALSTPAGFPLPVEMLAAPEPVLRWAGLSRAKVLSLKDLAARVLDGTVPGPSELRDLGDEQIVERFTAVRGIGRWTVEMLMIFGLGRPDVLPATDLGIRKGFALTFRTRRLPAPARVLAHGARWRPYRSVASWYLWRALELPSSL
ncbi:MAG: DNA-3-methyladenine glycosylase 2 family protein [Gemmatimonadetes bacterium]|nr:DNA-3-methyladenine glycosylase 2 family protein [Gemmatimonadota bacterium]